MRRPRRLWPAAAALAALVAGCLGDEQLRIECESDDVCPAGEVCRAQVCVSRAAIEVLEDVDCIGPACIPCEDCEPAPNERAVCNAGTCERSCFDGFVDLRADRPGCEYECTPDTDPTERCDARDNNCDGLVDAEAPDLDLPVCAEQRGVCEGSLPTCVAGGIVACDDVQYELTASGPWEGGPESRCDGLDNNCNGETDERCCGELDPRTVLTRGAGWEPLAHLESSTPTVYALHREAHGRRGAIATWSAPAGADYRAALDGAAPLCDVGERALTAALDGDGSTLAVVCAAGVSDARVVLRSPDGASVEAAHTLDRAPASIHIARIGARVAVVAEYRGPDGRAAGVGLIAFDTGAGTSNERALGSATAGPADVVAASEGLWLAVLDGGALLVEYATTSLSRPSASATLGSDGLRAVSLVPFGADAGMVGIDDASLVRALLRRDGGSVERIERGAGAHGLGASGGAAHVRARVVETGVLALAASGDTVAGYALAPGLERVETSWGAADVADAGRRALAATVEADELLVFDGRAPDAAGTPTDVFAILRIGADGGLLCP